MYHYRYNYGCTNPRFAQVQEPFKTRQATNYIRVINHGRTDVKIVDVNGKWESPPIHSTNTLDYNLGLNYNPYEKVAISAYEPDHGGWRGICSFSLQNTPICREVSALYDPITDSYFHKCRVC